MPNRLLLAAAAIALAGATPALADHGHDHDRDRHDNGHHDNGHHKGWYKGEAYGPPGQRHHWARGQYVPRAYLAPTYVVDYRVHHLRPPPPGYRWVRVDNDYLLVAFASGLIASIIVNQ